MTGRNRLRGVRTIAAAVALAVVTPLAYASGDYGCQLFWMLKHRRYSLCSNVPFLSPANDSRVNLLLLLGDEGLVTLDVSPSEWHRALGYATVPFARDDLRDTPTRDTALAPPADAVPDALTPAVDELLHAVAPGRADMFATGESSRCHSNTDRAARAFVAQLVATSDLSDAERRELASARLALVGGCDATATRPTVQPSTGRGKEFAAYLDGAAAFYAGRYDDARRSFDGLHDAGNAWLAETAGYMVGRTELNRAQRIEMRDGWPVLQTDRPALEASEAAFQAYLREHPDGRYAASARGLLRRVYWFMDDSRRLGREYAALLAHPETPRNVAFDRLIREMDAKLLGPGAEGIDDPRLAAVTHLMAMREPNAGLSPDSPATLRGRLEADRGAFAERPRLYRYLDSALRFYAEHDADGVLRRLPADAAGGPLDVLSFSEQTLRGFALEARGDWTAARALWSTLLGRATHPLQRAQLELAYAMNAERSGRLADVFAAESPVRTSQIREILLRYVAGPDLLRRQAADAHVAADERDVALFTLLHQELRRARYRRFLADLALLPKSAAPPRTDEWGLSTFRADIFAWSGGTTQDGYTCPSVRDVAATLQRNPRAPMALNCLGELRLRRRLDRLPPPPASGDELGGTPPAFHGPLFSRLDGYMTVMADRTASRADRAYALYRAINCFEPIGHNACGAQRVPRSRRRQWFRTLKTRYADTRWARDLRFWW